MKTLHFSLITASFLSLFLISGVYASGEVTCNGASPKVCTQTFAPSPLRYGVKYRFSDTWFNLSDTTQYMNNILSVDYEHPEFLGAGAKHPSGYDFDWTDSIVSAGYAVGAHSNKDILTTYGEDWQVILKPSNGRKNPSLGQYDFMIKYATTYDTSNNFPDASDDITHIENQPYYVTWCGDGVKDGPNDDADLNTPGIQAEECDGSDGLVPGKSCSSLCKLETIPTPSCTSLSATPTSGVGVFNVSLSCEGANLAPSPTYAISCGNGTNAIMGGDGKSGTCSYNNNSPLTNIAYNAVCNITSGGVNVAPSPSCNQSIIGYINPNNRFDLSLKKYVDTVAPANDADTAATAISKNPNTNFNYKIVVRNEGTGAVVGTTTVTDRIPSGLASTGMPYGSGWACHTGSVPIEFVCERSNSILKNESFPEITVPVWVPSNTASGTIITNTGTVYNSNETDVLPNTNPAVIQVVSSPQCSTSLSGALTAPITATTLNLCSVGTATGFGANTVGNTTNYAWSCNNIGSQSCTANYTVTPPTSQGTLSIKKYAGSMPAGDAQNESSAVNVTRDAEFNYLYRVTVSSGSLNGAIVKDVLPEYVDFVRFAVTPTGWSTGSTTTTHSGHTHSVVMHQTDNILASGSTYDFTIVARLRADAVGQYHQNIAYVCPKKILSGGSLIDNPSCDTTTIPPLPPDTGCSTLPNPPFMDPACIKTNDGFDLSIRKYINSDDAETAIDLSSGATFNYRMVVTNNGPTAVNGTTFVRDTFPTGVERTTGAITGSGWDCSASTAAVLSCYSTQTIAAGGVFSDIIVPMRVTAAPDTTVTNTACVENANEPAAKTFVGGDTTNCNNAILKTPRVECSDCTPKCEEVTKISSNTFSCRGNGRVQSFGVDWDGDNVIDYTDTFGGLNIKTFNVPTSSRPVGQSVKCIVSNYPNFPIVVGHNYNAEWSNYPFSLDTNDNSCKITSTPPPSICGNGIVEIGETCDPSLYVVGGANPLWTLCSAPETRNQCTPIGSPPPICGDGIVDKYLDTDPSQPGIQGETCDPSPYILGGPNRDWAGCGAPGTVSKIETSTVYDPCNGQYYTRFRTPGQCRFGRTETQPQTCNLPMVTINPAESPSDELALFDGRNIYNGYNLIIGQNTPVFRVNDKINLRSPGFVFIPEAGDKIYLKSQGDFITNTQWSRPLGVSCIGNALPGDKKNKFNSIWNSNTNSWELCEPLMNFSDFTNHTLDVSIHKGLSYLNWPSDKNRWNDARPRSTEYGQTNNVSNGSARTLNGDINLDFYVTMLHPGQNPDTDMNLPGAIKVRVTRPIIANNAGGAGYLSAPTSYVSIGDVTQGFLETLKAANFNTGKVVGGPTSSAFILNGVVPVGSNDLSTLTALTNSSARVMHIGDVTITTTPTPNIATKKTVVVNGKLTINADIKANASIAFIANEIVIGSGVTQLDGIYIANSIKGVSGGSQLIVNGSIYGNASDLIAARTYARGSSASSGIVTGILVNYSSRVLSDPPPLVTDFLKQYNLTKVTSVQ